MTFEVYALREIGSSEVRYVGQTGKGRATRLNFLVNLARARQGEHEMRAWLWDCGFKVEAILLTTAETREEAKAIERTAIQMFWAAGHRLVNLQGRPKEAPQAAVQLATRRMVAA